MARKQVGTGSTPATVALTRAGVAFTTHAYQHDPPLLRRAGARLSGGPAGASYGLEAAAALGLPAEQVFKTLLAEVDGRLAVAVVPVTGTLDLKALAAALGGKRAAMADPRLAERTTGYVVGGISPLGQKKPLPTVVDASAEQYDTVYVSGGRRGLDVGLAPADLVRATAARYAPIATHPSR